jgi:glycosyltransferase involved in cell wall biosynthesis
VCYDAARVRILFDYRPALRQRTGVGQYVHELAAALLRQLPRGDTLTIFSASWKDRLPRDLPAGALAVDLPIPVTLLNFAWHRLEMPAIERLAGQVDIAHSFHPLLMPARRAAQVVTVHDLDFLDHPERTGAEVRRDYPALAPAHARRADLVVTVSGYTSGQVRDRLGVEGDRIAVCRPGAPGWPTGSPAPPGGPILFVGTIEPRKNLPALFAAYEQVVGDMPGAPPLVLAGRVVDGSGEILGQVGARAAIAGRVQHLGYVDDVELQALYGRAAMLVLPSLEEGFGMTALEAMHMGVPVVASSRGALPEVVGDAGMLVDPLDAGALAAAIGRVLRDEPLRRKLSAAALERARRFSWDDSAATLLAAYRALISRRAARHPR